MMLTTDGIRFVSVPIVVIRVLQKENFATHCDIKKCPLRNIQ